MTPAGRPPRSDSPSKKTVTIRMTIEEHDLFSRAAHPLYLSDWFRGLAMQSPEVAALQPAKDDEPANVTDIRSQVAMVELKLRTSRDKQTDPEKIELFDQFSSVMRKIVGVLIQYANASQPDR